MSHIGNLLKLEAALQIAASAKKTYSINSPTSTMLDSISLGMWKECIASAKSSLLANMVWHHVQPRSLDLFFFRVVLHIVVLIGNTAEASDGAH
jgi:hypothetical protein